jgi:hypothetical protein
LFVEIVDFVDPEFSFPSIDLLGIVQMDDEECFWKLMIYDVVFELLMEIWMWNEEH